MKALTSQKEIVTGAPSPELVDLWLARAFNAHDVEAAAAMYHPDASVVRLDQVHGTVAVACGAAGIREAMAGYIGLKPHMDVVVHHTTVSGAFALCRSRWRFTGTDQDGNRLKSTTMGWRSLSAKVVGGSSSSTTLREPTRRGQWIILHQRVDGHGRVCALEKMLAIKPLFGARERHTCGEMVKRNGATVGSALATQLPSAYDSAQSNPCPEQRTRFS